MSITSSIPPRVDSPASNDPLHQVLRVYDDAIHALRRGDVSRARRAVSLLRAAHPADSPSASGIDGLYRFCEQAMASGDLIGAAHTLRQLRDAWAHADQVTRALSPVAFPAPPSPGATAR